MTRHGSGVVTIIVVVIITILWEHKGETETREGIELKNEEIIMIIKAKEMSDYLALMEPNSIKQIKKGKLERNNSENHRKLLETIQKRERKN